MSVAKIESFAGRLVTISRDPTANNLRKCHQQSQSRLFALPAEVRNAIWEITIKSNQERVNSSRTFTSGLSYRPDYERKPPVPTGLGLLYLCRRVWLEANAYALEAFSDAEHCFWLRDDEHKPSDWKDEHKWDDQQRFSGFMQNLSRLERHNLKRVHFYVQCKYVKDDGVKLGTACRELHSDVLARLQRDGRKVALTVLTVTMWDVNWDPMDFREVHYVTEWLQRLLNTAQILGVETFRFQVANVASGWRDLLPDILRQMKAMRGLGGAVASFLMSTPNDNTSKLDPYADGDVCEWMDFPLKETSHDVKQHELLGPQLYRAMTLIWRREPTCHQVPKKDPDMAYWRSWVGPVGTKFRSNLEDVEAQFERRWRGENSLLEFKTPTHASKDTMPVL